jgi:hypothetical protein
MTASTSDELSRIGAAEELNLAPARSQNRGWRITRRRDSGRTAHAGRLLPLDAKTFDRD